MKARRPIALILLAGAAFMAAPGREGTVAAEDSPPSPSDVTVTLMERSRYEVEGAFEAPVPLSVAWHVLTDYEDIGRFVPAVRRSWVADRREREVMVGQDVAGGWMFFSRRIVLRLKVVEIPLKEVSFEELSGKDFVSYSGKWTLEERPGGTLVTYRLRTEPRFHVPGFIVRGVYKRAARDLLRGIRDEMVRRNGGGHAR